ncbi:MAG: bifunctional diguanylate cyclase/phosphodiesterase [Pseudomonadota bacterium]
MSSDIFEVQSTGSSQVQLKLKRSRAELDWLYALDQRVSEERHGQARLARLVGELTRLLNMSYSVLLVPSKNIRISVTHSHWNGVDRRKLDSKMLRRLFPRYSSSDRPVVLELPNLPEGARGSDDGYQMVLQPIRDASGEATGVLACFCQVDGKPLANTVDRQVLYVARLAQRVIAESYDRLTGLMLRDDFLSVLDASVDDLTMGQDSHSLVYFDIDKLTLINDTFDTAAGDDVLLRFSKMLHELAPSGATVARISGDKFAVLLRFRDEDAGREFAELIRVKCKELNYVRGAKSVPVTVSAGVVSLSDHRSHDESPIVAARLACSKAKDYGRDQVAMYDEADKSIVRRLDTLHLFTRLQDAIEHGDFTLDVQPIVPLALESSAGAHHYEVLLRMVGLSGDILLPEQFFEAAEQYQLMPKVDRLVIEKFFAEIDRCEDQAFIENASFAINLSGQSLGDPAFHQFVADSVKSCALAPEQICFEITETAAISNRESAIAFMQGLRDLGCRLALDDFGAGLSSFAYLRDMPVDTLKIDGSFVQEISESKTAEAMVTAISEVARVMGLETVAECVETDDVRDLLVDIGVTYAQGFLVGKPRPLTDELRGTESAATVVDITDRLKLRAGRPVGAAPR